MESNVSTSMLADLQAIILTSAGKLIEKYKAPDTEETHSMVVITIVASALTILDTPYFKTKPAVRHELLKQMAAMLAQAANEQPLTESQNEALQTLFTKLNIVMSV